MSHEHSLATDGKEKEWVRARAASFEVQPLVEMHDGERVQVGFELCLFARLGKRPEGVHDRVPEMLEIHRGLRQILEEIVPADHPVARVEVEPFRAAVKLRAQSDFAPEVQLSARVVRRQETFEPLRAEARQGLAFVEQALAAMGLRRGGG